jgi:hypothetical protein
MKAPVRWLDEPGALPDELRASMAAYAELGPSERKLARIRAGVRAHQAPVVLKWLGVVSVLAGLAGLVWSLRGHEPPAPPRALPVATAARAEAAPRVEEPSMEPRRGEPPAAMIPAPAKPSVRARRAAPVVAVPPAASAAAELDLLRRARRLLASDPKAALALTDEHFRSYPAGVFAEERELLAIEALSQRDGAAAIERARSFASKYPRSVHQARIEAALGAH